MSLPTRIRILLVDHADLVLRRLQEQCLPADVATRTSTGWWWIAADEDGAAVGFAGMRAVKTWPGTVYFCRAGVLPAYRGRGLQRRLIQARLRKARALGMQRAITDCTTRNWPSARNLIATGFRPYWPSNDWGLENSIYWIREL